MEPSIQRKRLEKLQAAADVLLEKLRQRVEETEPLSLNPQSMKHISGVMKDLKDIQLTKLQEEQEGRITVVLAPELEEYCQ